MGARVIQLADYRIAKPAGAMASVAAAKPADVENSPELADRFQFWTGASGRRYVHTVYSLVECPALPAGNYVLVNRDADGNRHVLSIGRVSHVAATLNLAEIRRRGADLGANEVHIHLLAASAKQSRMVEADLLTAQSGGAVASGARRH